MFKTIYKAKMLYDKTEEDKLKHLRYFSSLKPKLSTICPLKLKPVIFSDPYKC